MKIFKKKGHFEGRNDGIWPKNDEPSVEYTSLTHFQLKSGTNLRESKFRHKLKRVPKQNFFKKCHFGG